MTINYLLNCLDKVDSLSILSEDELECIRFNVIYRYITAKRLSFNEFKDELTEQYN